MESKEGGTLHSVPSGKLEQEKLDGLFLLLIPSRGKSITTGSYGISWPMFVEIDMFTPRKIFLQLNINFVALRFPTFAIHTTSFSLENQVEVLLTSIQD